MEILSYQKKKVSDQKGDVYRALIKEVMKEARERAKSKKVHEVESVDFEAFTDHSNSC